MHIIVVTGLSDGPKRIYTAKLVDILDFSVLARERRRVLCAEAPLRSPSCPLHAAKLFDILKLIELNQIHNILFLQVLSQFTASKRGTNHENKANRICRKNTVAPSRYPGPQIYHR